jgi:hypothetical protein
VGERSADERQAEERDQTDGDESRCVLHGLSLPSRDVQAISEKKGFC